MTAEPDGLPSDWPELVDAAGLASAKPGTELERRADDVEPVGPVLDAELVDEEPAQSAVARVLQPVVVVVTRVRQSEPTMRAGKAVLRNTAWVFTGLGAVLKDWWDHRTGGLYHRQIASAEASGDQDGLKHWEQRAEKARDKKHKRRVDRVKLLKQLPGAAFATVALGALILVMLGLAFAVHNGDITTALDPLIDTVTAIGTVVGVLMWLAGWLLLLGLTLALVGLRNRGRRAATAQWLQAPRQEDPAGALLTADAIVRALQYLSIPKLDKAFKDGWQIPFELPPTREGQGEFKGYRAIFGLPEGVTPGMLADKRDVFANNISRIGMEVWPSDYGQEKGGRARHVNLYVADRGVMDKPTPEYPLMYEGSADVFEGVPIGITQRGDTVLMPMNGSNFVFGGRPGQGKSNGVRVVFAGAALDPLCELRVHVFAGNGDFDAYEKRLSRYQKGAKAEHYAAAVVHLEELLAEVERREYRLADLGAKKLTRSISQQHSDMRPLLVGFSECHEMFGDKDSGELAADLAIPVVKRGRKAGVMLGFDTQSSRANAIPSQLVENMGVNGCFSVKTWRNNDGFLGDGSFAAGIRATELRFNVDRGTMLMTGVSDELFEIVRTFFIEVNDDTGWDAATEIIERAVAQMKPQARIAAATPLALVEARDLLADVAEVLGEETVPAADVPALLARNFPTWLPYRSLTGKQLRERLRDEYGVKVPSTDNRWPVASKLIADALARRTD